MEVMNGFILSSNLEKLLNLFSQNFDIRYLETKNEKDGVMRNKLLGGKIEKFGNPNLLNS